MPSAPQPATMTAAAYHRYGPPEVVRTERLPVPIPGRHDILIAVHAGAIGPADCAARSARPVFVRLVSGLLRPKNPVLGTDVSGTVAAVGADVTGWRPGDRVLAATGIGYGGHAQYVVVSQDAAVALPESISHHDGVTLIGGALTALPFLRDHARLRPGQRILINGASGAVGSAAVLLAKHLGARVTAVCSGPNVALVRSLGADEVIDYTRQDFTRAPGGYHAVFDAVGKSTFARCARLLTGDGVYLTTVPSLGILAQALRTRIVGRRRAVLALTGLRPAAAKAADLAVLVDLAADGRLPFVTDRHYRLDELAEAHRYVDTGRKRGTVVIDVPHAD
jgi:NADPH:quinone reductase-like Zn-dependent oxidoreductase